MIRIEVLNGLEQGRVIELASGTWVLGRRDGVDFKIIGDAVSGRHLEVEVLSESEVRFKDLKTTNGTWAGGLKVEEGEWFAGSELRLGNLCLKLLATDEQPSSAVSADHQSADAELHSRAVEEALSSGSKGGPLMMALLVVVVGAAIGAWFTFGKTPDLDDGSMATAKVNPGTNAQSFDAIDNLGQFDEVSIESWQLSSGLSMASSTIRSSGGRQRATLLPTFSASLCSFEFSATTTGNLKVWPEIEWGSGETDSLGRWSSGDLSSGSSSLNIPCQNNEWYRLSLRFSGEGSIKNLVVNAATGDGASRENADSGRRFIANGANLYLEGLSGEMLRAQGAGGNWASVPGGLTFTGKNAWLDLEFLGAQVLVLTDADPVPASKGMEIQNATGLILRGERPSLFMFAAPQLIRVSNKGAIRLDPCNGMTIDWDLTSALTRAAQLNLDIKRFDRQQDTARLLEAVQELVQHYPLNEQEVEHAEELRVNAIRRGQDSLSQLERQVAESMFLGAAKEMERVATDAQSLADSLPGTNVAKEATAIFDLLTAEKERVLADSRAAEAEYRRRLLGALKRSYPVMANWLEGAE